MANTSTETKRDAYGRPYRCDLCGERQPDGALVVDGRTIHGSWAWLCINCFGLAGRGIGTGRGQVYCLGHEGKVAG